MPGVLLRKLYFLLQFPQSTFCQFHSLYAISIFNVLQLLFTLGLCSLDHCPVLAHFCIFTGSVIVTAGCSEHFKLFHLLWSHFLFGDGDMYAFVCRTLKDRNLGVFLFSRFKLQILQTSSYMLYLIQSCHQRFFSLQFSNIVLFL